MDRRAFIIVVGGSMLVGPLVAEAQLPGTVPRVGVIHHGGDWQLWAEGLQQGLRELGLDEGRHLVLETRETRGDLKAVEVAARDLERGKVTLICTAATSVTLAAKRATTQTPIVFFAGSDPVTAGLVEGFAKSGGRLTGVYNRLLDLTGKRLEILKEMIPKLARVVTFYDPGNTVAQEGARLGRQAAQQLGVQLIERRVSSIEELRVSLQELKPREVDAYFYTPDAMVGANHSWSSMPPRRSDGRRCFTRWVGSPKGPWQATATTTARPAACRRSMSSAFWPVPSRRTCRSRATTRSSSRSIAAPPGRSAS
jgi:ABC-type uncharacterized transport system substrate-binding protein